MHRLLLRQKAELAYSPGKGITTDHLRALDPDKRLYFRAMRHIARRLLGIAFGLVDLVVKFCDLLLRVNKRIPILEHIKLNYARDRDQRQDADQDDLLLLVLR